MNVASMKEVHELMKSAALAALDADLGYGEAGQEFLLIFIKTAIEQEGGLGHGRNGRVAAKLKLSKQHLSNMISGRSGFRRFRLAAMRSSRRKPKPKTERTPQ